MNITINSLEEVEIDMEEMLEKVELCISKRNQTAICMMENSNTRTNRVLISIQIEDKRKNMDNMQRNSQD